MRTGQIQYCGLLRRHACNIRGQRAERLWVLRGAKAQQPCKLYPQAQVRLLHHAPSDGGCTEGPPVAPLLCVHRQLDHRTLDSDASSARAHAPARSCKACTARWATACLTAAKRTGGTCIPWRRKLDRSSLQSTIPQRQAARYLQRALSQQQQSSKLHQTSLVPWHLQLRVDADPAAAQQKPACVPWWLQEEQRAHIDRVILGAGHRSLAQWSGQQRRLLSLWQAQPLRPVLSSLSAWQPLCCLRLRLQACAPAASCCSTRAAARQSSQSRSSLPGSACCSKPSPSSLGCSWLHGCLNLLAPKPA